jgi:hypothetical protein
VAAEIVYGGLSKTVNGFKIVCAHCRKGFESKGLRCCSPECERAQREREVNLAVLAEAGIEPKARRRCECCDAVIPTWRKGRRVSSKTRFVARIAAQKAVLG